MIDKQQKNFYGKEKKMRRMMFKKAHQNIIHE